MNLIRKKYSNEAFFMLNLSKLTVRASMLPMILEKELSPGGNLSQILNWFDQDADNETKIRNFKDFFGKDYSKLKYNYVNYLETLNQVNCQFILAKTHLNVEKTRKEVLSKLVNFLSFIGDTINIVDNQIIIDELSFDLDIFIDAYIDTCNLVLSPKIKKSTIEAYRQSLNVDSISLFDCFIIKLHSNLIDSRFITDLQYKEVIEKIQYYYMDLVKKVA